MAELGEKLRKLRIEKRLTQKYIADLCGITPTAYTFIENGTTKNITIEVGKGISKALEVPFNELFDIESNSDEIASLVRSLEDASKLIKTLTERNEYLQELSIFYFVKIYATEIDAQIIFNAADSIINEQSENNNVLQEIINHYRNQLKKEIEKGTFTKSQYLHVLNFFNRDAKKPIINLLETDNSNTIT